MRLIGADALMETINRQCYPVQHDMTSIEPGMTRIGILQAIQEQPTIEPGPQWIPVSERLPTARQSVILSTKDYTGEGCYWETTEYHVIWKGYRWNATYWDDEVVAWMPLPEPYKEDGEQE